MFTPKMPFLLVLVGDPAVKEAEHTLSALQDHVNLNYQSLVELICLVENPEAGMIRPGNGIRVSYYKLEQALQEGSFSGLVREKREGINNRIPAELTGLVIHSRLAIAFVVRGVQVPAEQVFSLHGQARHMLDAIGISLTSQLCYLTEDDPTMFSAQSQWLKDPEDARKARRGFHEFRNLMVLSARQAGGYEGIEVQHQQKEAFPLGLLALVSRRVESLREAAGGTSLVTMRFGKISGSSYEIRQMVHHISAEHLKLWAARDMGAEAAWAFLSNRRLNLEQRPGVAYASNAKERVLAAVEEGLVAMLPGVEDLACVGLTDRDASMEEVVLSFNAFNEERFFSEASSLAWAEAWMRDVLAKVDDHVLLDSLAGYLGDEGLIGSAIYNARLDAQRKSEGIGDSEAWLKDQWSLAQGVQPQPRWLEKDQSYLLRVLAGLHPALCELWKFRGRLARLSALDAYRRKLHTEIKSRMSRRDGLLAKYNLSPQEMAVLGRTCESYMNNTRSVAANTVLEDLPQYQDLVNDLYHPERLEEVWDNLFLRFIQRAYTQQQSFASAFCTDAGNNDLVNKVVNYANYNDGTLLLQLPINAGSEALTVYPVAAPVHEGLRGARNQVDEFVRIPGDLVEKMSLLFLGGIDQLTTLRMFQEIQIAAPPVPVAMESLGESAQPGASEPAPQDSVFDARLIRDGNAWKLYWDWVGPRDQQAKLSWNGQTETVGYPRWFQQGQGLTLQEGRIPYGRFTMSFACGGLSGQAELDGKTLSIRLQEQPLRKTVKTIAGEVLQGVNLEISGEISKAQEVCVLRKDKHTHSFLYNIFGFSDPSEPSVLGPIYLVQGETLTLEGVGRMEGFIKH